MKSWWFLSAGVVLVVVAGAAASHVLTQGPDDRIPSAEEAEAAIGYAFAHAGDESEVFCEVAATAGNCRVLLEAAPTPPEEAPKLLCSQVYEPAGEGLRPGRVVRVTGTDGSGSRYVSNVLAITDGDSTVLLNPVFWDSTGINDSDRSDLPLEVECADDAAAGSGSRSDS